jgi:alpha-beta hydrolase superfamily lysophospholipase
MWDSRTAWQRINVMYALTLVTLLNNRPSLDPASFVPHHCRNQGLTAHSLGGYIAAACAAKLDYLPAVVFNSPVVPVIPNVLHLTLNYDPVSAPIQLAANCMVMRGAKNTPFGAPARAHKMNHVREAVLQVEEWGAFKELA